MPSKTTNKRLMRRLHNWHKHPLVLPFGLFLTLFFFSLGMFVSSGATTIGASDVRVVTLSIDGEKQVVPTRARTVMDLLERLEIELHESDVIEPSLRAELEHDSRVNIYTSRTVVIVDGDERQFFDTAEPEPRDVVKAAEIELYDEDIVERDNSEPLDALEILIEGAVSEKVIIMRSVPVMLNLFGVDYELRTHANTVEELLLERDVNVAEASVFPGLDSQLTETEAIFVTDPDKEIVMEEEEIAPEQEYVDDNTMPGGQTQLRDEGAPGRRVVVYEISEDGSRSTLQEVVIVKPKPRVIVRGTKPISRSNEAILYDLRMCESGGNYQINTGNGFYGAYQFMIPTWDSIARLSDRPDLVGVRPDQASPADQDFLTLQNGRISGFHGQYPGCSRMLNLPNRPN